MEEAPATQDRLLAPDTDQQTHEIQKFLVRRERLPVVPTQVVVLTIRVVVAALSTTDLIPTQEHRRALREEERGEEISPLSGPRFQDRFVFRRPFNAIVSRDVVVRAVEVG